jgi:hypothetical protein
MSKIIILILLCVVISAGAYGWHRYNRPSLVRSTTAYQAVGKYHSCISFGECRAIGLTAKEAEKEFYDEATGAVNSLRSQDPGAQQINRYKQAVDREGSGEYRPTSLEEVEGCDRLAWLKLQPIRPAQITDKGVAEQQAHCDAVFK